MQREQAWLVLLYGVAAIAILLPIAVAMRLADYQSLQREQQHAAGIAVDIVRRSDQIAAQIGVALSELAALHAEPARSVAPPRATIGAPSSWQTATATTTSSASRGTTTPIGTWR